MDRKVDRPLELVLVRHAESERNKVKKDESFFADEYARNKVRGIADEEVELTEAGKSQARITGHVLKQSFGVFDYVYHTHKLSLRNLMAFVLLKIEGPAHNSIFLIKI